MSVKLLWKALGSNHRMFVVQWRMQLSLSGLLPWMIGPTDHTQKHIGNFVRVCLVASESYHLLSSQRANQISILPGQIKSFNYIWPIGSSQSAYHNNVTSSSSYQELSTRISPHPHLHPSKKKKHRHRLSRTILSSHHIHQRKIKKRSQKKKKSQRNSLSRVLKRKSIISGESE